METKMKDKQKLIQIGFPEEAEKMMMIMKLIMIFFNDLFIIRKFYLNMNKYILRKIQSRLSKNSLRTPVLNVIRDNSYYPIKTFFMFNYIKNWQSKSYINLEEFIKTYEVVWNHYSNRQKFMESYKNIYNPYIILGWIWWCFNPSVDLQ